MAKRMVRLSANETSEMLAYKGQRKTEPHQMTRKIFHWRYCARCGLLGLNNDVTRRALRKVCVTWE